MAGSQSSVMHMSSVAELYGLSYVVQTLKVRILHLGLVIHPGSSITPPGIGLRIPEAEFLRISEIITKFITKSVQD